jgi:hypothetical protein
MSRMKKIIRFQNETPKIFPPPTIYARGLFAGLGLMSARKPEGFVDEFFNNEKLSEIWDEGLKVYRAVSTKWETSGYHSSVPRYACMYVRAILLTFCSRFHFVKPGTKILYSDVDCSCCFSAIKRWDSIAFFEFGEIYPNFTNHFDCEVTGGAGGLDAKFSIEGTPASSSVTKTPRSRGKRLEGVEETQSKFIQELATAMKPAVADPQLLLTQELLQVSQTLRELLSTNDSSDDELITFYKNKKIKLRYEVLLVTYESLYSLVCHVYVAFWMNPCSFLSLLLTKKARYTE